MAIATNTKVLTLDYWKRAEQLKVGDWVFDKDGNPTQIKLIQTYYSEECYEVTLDDYLSVSGDGRLSFMLENEKYRNRAIQFKMVWQKGFTRPLKRLSVLELLEKGLEGRPGRKEYSIQTTKPLKLPNQDFGIPPFIFGYWYTNRKKNKRFNIYQDNREFVFQKFKDAGYRIDEHETPWFKWNYFTVSPNIETQMAPNIPSKIPANYIMASEEQRVELLSGLVNGSFNRYKEKSGKFWIRSRNFADLQQIQGLVESLGIKSAISYLKLRDSYGLSFKTKHKLAPYQDPKPLKVYHDRRYIKEITKIQPQMVVHIETDAPDNTIAVAEGFISVC